MLACLLQQRERERENVCIAAACLPDASNFASLAADDRVFDRLTAQTTTCACLPASLSAIGCMYSDPSVWCAVPAHLWNSMDPMHIFVDVCLRAVRHAMHE
uniref:Uncharacterized protein n=1 Tax=Vitrella brassicaformis TaxID=1169539 RepID=A0A7S1JTI3_9ALVE